MTAYRRYNHHAHDGWSESGQLVEYPEPSFIDSAAFYGLAGDYVAAVEPHTESDPVALLVQFLLAL